MEQSVWLEVPLTWPVTQFCSGWPSSFLEARTSKGSPGVHPPGPGWRASVPVFTRAEPQSSNKAEREAAMRGRYRRAWLCRGASSGVGREEPPPPSFCPAEITPPPPPHVVVLEKKGFQITLPLFPSWSAGGSYWYPTAPLSDAGSLPPNPTGSRALTFAEGFMGICPGILPGLQGSQLQPLPHPHPHPWLAQPCSPRGSADGPASPWDIPGGTAGAQTHRGTPS